tara:strand:- start:3521 stop:5911 length:2391 start_codon:yes stop_codon:yes gene_type:complete
MAEPRKTITPSYMKGTSSGSRADRILRERAARERDAVREQDRVRQLAATIEQEEIGSQYYSSDQQGRLRQNPISQVAAIQKEAERVKAVLDREQAASDREQAAREERAKNPYAINTDIQQEESRNQGNPLINASNVNPSKDPLFKDAVEKAEARPRRPKPATPQDSQELELKENKYGIGSMGLLTDAEIQRQDEDIKKAAEEKAAEEEAKAKRKAANLRASEEVLRKQGMIDRTNQRASDPLADEPAFGSAGYNISRDFQEALAPIETAGASQDLIDWSRKDYEASRKAAKNQKEAEAVLSRETARIEALIEEENKKLEDSSSQKFAKDTSPRFVSNVDIQQQQEDSERGNVNVVAPAPMPLEVAEKVAAAEILQDSRFFIGQGTGESEKSLQNPFAPKGTDYVNEVIPAEADSIVLDNPTVDGTTRLSSEALASALNTNNPYQYRSASEVASIHSTWADEVRKAQYNEKAIPQPDWALLSRIRGFSQYDTFEENEARKNSVDKIPSKYNATEPSYGIDARIPNYGLSQKDYDKALKLNLIEPWTENTYNQLQKRLEEIKDTTKVQQSNNATEVETNFSSSSALSDNTVGTISTSEFTSPSKAPDGSLSTLALNTEQSFPVQKANEVIKEIDAEDVKQIAFNIIDKEGHDKSLTPEDYKNNPVINGQPVKEWTFSDWETKSNKKVKKDQYPSVIVYKADENTWAKVDLESGVVNTIRTKKGEDPPSRWKVPLKAIKVAKENTPPNPNLPSGFIVLETQKKTPKNKKFNVRGKEGNPGYTVGVTKGQVKFRRRALIR